MPQLSMAELTSRGHPFVLQSSDFSRCRSSKFHFTSPASSGPFRMHSFRPRKYDHVSWRSPRPPSPVSWARSESLAQSPMFSRPQICGTGSSRLRFASCFHVRRGAGIQRSSLTRFRGEAAAESVRATSSRDAWEGGISFNSRRDCLTERDRERWTQSVSVEPNVKPPFELAPIQQDTGMAFLVLVGAFVWVRLFDFFTSKDILGQKLSRKIVHITSGLFYMLCWPFFSSSKWAPFIAGMVPLANGVRLMIYGLGVWKDEGLVKSMSRSGESRELLRGPLYYVLVLYFSTVLFWRQSPVGMIALSMMCGGDGIADIMGRKFGAKKLPYNSDKSIAGSVAMFLFGFLVSSICLYYFSVLGFFKLEVYTSAVRLVVISMVATVVESLPITTQLDDNFTVPATVFLLGYFLFHSS